MNFAIVVLREGLENLEARTLTKRATVYVNDVVT